MRTILAAIDFSDVSQKVIQNAADLATVIGARLHILHAAAPDPDFIGYEVGPQHERDYRAKTLSQEHKQLNEIADEQKAAGITSSCSLREGAIADIVLSEAKECNAEMIVMGSHGHGALFSLVVGSATQEVLRHSPIPVLVVPVRECY